MEGALDARLMAGEAVELGLDLVVVEQVQIGSGAGAEVSLHATDAAQVPGGSDQLVEDGLLKRPFRSDVVLESSEQFVELLAILGADEEVFGGEPMLAGVFGSPGFTFRCSWTGAETRVGSVGA